MDLDPGETLLIWIWALTGPITSLLEKPLNLIEMSPKVLMEMSLLDSRAKHPFEFHAAYYPPIYAGVKAYSLGELIEGIRRVDGYSIFYHVFHPVFSSHVVPYYLHNDFSVWIRDELHDSSLAYLVSDVEGREPRTVEQVRESLLEVLKRGDPDTRGQRPFHFLTCRPVVYDTGRRAWTLGEFIDTLSEITMRSVIYHLVFGRAMGYSPRNDFSAWLIQEFKAVSLADRISSIDPQTYVEEEKLREDLLTTIEEIYHD